MKKSLAGFIATSLTMSTMIPIALASTATNGNWFKINISVDGTTLSNPYAVAQSDGSSVTTYVPMYYVDEALTKVGYQVSWDGTAKTWSLTSSDTSLTLPNDSVGSGTTSIRVNGTTIKKLNTIVDPDPEGGANTTYIPIYYVTPLFKALGATATWDGSTHAWSITTSGSNSSGTSTSGLSTPTIQLQQSSGTSNVAVRGAQSGSTLTLYDSSGSKVVSTVADSNGTATFYNVGAGSYYVVATTSGEISDKSNVVSIKDKSKTSAAPTVYSSSSNGAWYIQVSNAVPSAQIALYSTNGSQINTATADQYGLATFVQVSPGSYYIVETSSGGGSVQSNAISVGDATTTPATPHLSVSQNNGSGTITVSGVTASADVTLYDASGNVYSSTSANSSGDASFNDVPSGTYYAIQTVNAVESAASNNVTVNSETETTPSLSVDQTNGVGTITVTNVTATATVTLYSTSGQVYSIVTANSSGVATFYSVPSGTYYAVQSVNGAQSSSSNTVTISATNTLSAPVLTVSNSGNGTGTISGSSLSANATVTLYTVNGSVYSSSTANSSGSVTFNNVPSGTYYALQTLSGQQSPVSNYVTTSTTTSSFSTPTISLSTVNSQHNIVISNVEPNATVTLYSSNGTTYLSTTADATGTAAFDDVSSGTYYAKQTWNGSQSSASSEVSV